MDLHAGQCYSVPETPAAVQRQSEIVAEIRSLYLAGVPLFTKEQIYAIRKQFKDLDGKPGKVLVTGINGSVTEFVLNTGDILPSHLIGF